jgi:hypothetical protein
MLTTLPLGRQCLDGPDIRGRYIHTTLYDLIEALYDQVGPGEEALVLAIIIDMVRSGRLVFHGTLPEAKV